MLFLEVFAISVQLAEFWQGWEFIIYFFSLTVYTIKIRQGDENTTNEEHYFLNFFCSLRNLMRRCVRSIILVKYVNWWLLINCCFSSWKWIIFMTDNSNKVLNLYNQCSNIFILTLLWFTKTLSMGKMHCGFTTFV